MEGKIGGGIEVTERRGRRWKQLLDDLKERGRCWKSKEEALYRPLWRTGFGRGYGTIVRRTSELMCNMETLTVVSTTKIMCKYSQTQFCNNKRRS